MKNKILIIEDEEVIADVLNDSMTALGYEIYVANSGLEGLKRAEHLRPDVILLDVMMPGLDGIEVLKELKNSNQTKDIPVILISIAGGEYIEEGLNLGAVAFFRKPLDFEHLDKKIKSITKKKTVLLIEDNKEILELVAVRLKESGYKVIKASEGKTAIKKAKQERPDIILTDIVLPDIDGLKLTRTLKKSKETVNIPVVAFSGYLTEELEGKKDILGIDRFLGKKFSANDLADEVDKFIRKD